MNTYLGSFENLQDAEPCNQKGSGAQKGGWCEMLEENRKIMRQEVVKRLVSKHHLHIM